MLKKSYLFIYLLFIMMGKKTKEISHDLRKVIVKLRDEGKTLLVPVSQNPALVYQNSLSVRREAF